jgi:hypothetical protein
MARRLHSLLLAGFILFLFSATLVADTIELKSGRIIEGEIIEETEELVAIEMETGTGFFSKEDIKSINKTRLDIAKGRIVEMSGTVDVLRKGKVEWEPAEEGTTLGEGDKLRSGPDSKAIATFANQLIMAVEQKSEVDLEKLQQSPKRGVNIKVNLDNGQIWNDVGRLKTKWARFHIETPQAVTGVRGTAFTVQTEPEAGTRVAVVSGTVDVRTRGLIMTPIKVAQNNMTQVTEDKPPTAPAPISEEFLAQWDQYRNKFRMLRVGMLGAALGLSPMQTLVLGVAVVVLVIVIAVVMLVRRRTA